MLKALKYFVSGGRFDGSLEDIKNLTFSFADVRFLRA